MRYTIEGFSQTEAIKFRRTETVNRKNPRTGVYEDKETVVTLDCTDLVILRWLVDFWPRMIKVEIGGCSVLGGQMEAINNYDLKDVYCPYRQGQCVSTCAMLMYDSDGIYIGTHSWEDEDGYPRQASVYQRCTDYWCGIAHTEDGRCANKTRIHGPVICDGKPFDGMTDENIRELAEVRGEES